MKLTVVLTSEEVLDLQYQAKVDDISITDCIRRSLALGRVAWNAQRQGGTLMIQAADGKVMPIQLPKAPS